MKKILFILLLTIPFVGFGQGWEKTYGGYGGDMGYSLDITSDSGFIVTGYTMDSLYGVQTFLIKINSQGDSVWSNSFGDTLGDKGLSVKQTTDGGYIITGYKDLYLDSSKVYLIKTDDFGNQQWEKTYNRPRSIGYFVQQTTDGGYIISGRTDVINTSNITSGTSGVLLIKTDSYGDTIWTKIYHNENINSLGKSIQQTTDGGYIICGYKSSKGYLMKTNSSGDTIWTKTYENGDITYTYSVKQTIDGGYIFCGRTFISTNPSIRKSLLIKTDSQGDTTWTRTYDGGMYGDSPIGKSVIQTIDGGYMIYNGYLDTTLVKLIKTDSQGNTTWTKVYQGTVSGNYETEIKQTHDGGYVFCGGRHNLQGDVDLLIIKTDGNGNITSTFNIPTPSSNRKLVKVVDVLGRKTKPQTNTPFIEIYDDGSTEKKIVVE